MSDSRDNVQNDEDIDVDDIVENVNDNNNPTTVGESVSSVEAVTVQQPTADIHDVIVQDESHKAVQQMSESITDSTVGSVPMTVNEQQEPKKIQNNDTATTTIITAAKNSGGTTTSNSNTNTATLIAENEALKDKVSKLKALLGRSAKAQREAKMEAELTQKKLQEALAQNDKLQQKINKLSNRPTYMEMLADFETNFDRALLSVGTTAAANAAAAAQQQQQTGGQDTASPVLLMTTNSTSNNTSTAVVDTMLVQELNDAKQRIEKLERMNQSLIDRAKHIESDVIGQYHRQLNELKNTIQRLELEKKMAVLEHEHACKELKLCTANMNEMQYEIDLLTQTSKKYQMKASVHEEIVKNTNHDKNKIQQLEQQMKALEEWAIASNEAKTLAQQHTRSLEQQLMNMKKQLLVANHSSLSTTTMDSGMTSQNYNTNNMISTPERIILSKNGSFVVGAGDLVYKCFELEESIVKTILLSERVVLRWKFDLQSHDRDILFSIIRGPCPDVASANKKLQQASNSGSSNSSTDEVCLIHNRTVVGGAEGETDHAFTYQRCCTLIWSNKQSWIRPKTIKYTVDAVVI